jgi:nitroreductase/NAD-dependent dihydropyrimidine dehydrogenase PreA subunit
VGVFEIETIGRTEKHLKGDIVNIIRRIAMGVLTIDKKICCKDKRCIEICPIQLLQMNQAEGVPEFVDGGVDICINCGHCFAVCPTGALKLSTMDIKNASLFEQVKLPTAEQVELLLKGRRSIRCYKDEPLSKLAVDALLDIARYAPSGINRQPVSWAVLLGKEKVHDLAALVAKWIEKLLAVKDKTAIAFNLERLTKAWEKGKDLICRDAPCVVTAYGVKDDPLVPSSCMIAGAYFELAAFGFGLGACWDGYVNMAINCDEQIKKFVGLPSRATAGAVLLAGQPKYRYPRIPARNPAKTIWR